MKALVLAAAALALASCSTVSSLTATPTLTAHKTLLVAVASVDGAAVALDTAAKSGYLKGSAAAKAAADLATAQSYLNDAKAAEAALDQTTLTARVTAIAALVATIMTEAGQ